MVSFVKAERSQQKLKLAIFGPPGSGKTYSSLLLAKNMGAKKIAVIDTEKSAALYSSKFDYDVADLDIDIFKSDRLLSEFAKTFQGAIDAGYDFIIVDSFTHVWDAVKDLHAKMGGTFTDWKKVNPHYKNITHLVLHSSVHTIVNYRAKYNDVLVENEVNGKKTYKVDRKGLKAEAREGTEYEFTTVFSLNMNHTFNVAKDRTGLFEAQLLPDGIARDFDNSVAKELLGWLNSGKEVVKPITAVKENVIDVKALVDGFVVELSSEGADIEMLEKKFDLEILPLIKNNAKVISFVKEKINSKKIGVVVNA